MTKIFAFFSPSVKRSLLCAGLAVALLAMGFSALGGTAPAVTSDSKKPQPLRLAQLGSIDDHLAKNEIWRGSRFEGSEIFVVRAENWKRPAGKSCGVYLKGIRSVPDGAVIPHSLESMYQMLPMTQAPDLPPWEPFREEDRKAIEECDEFPCLVKLTKRENRDLQQTRKDLRKKMWQAQTMARGDRYRKIGIPEGYEDSSFPVEPWSRLEKEGLAPAQPRKGDIELLMRTLHFGDGRIRPIRQILDRRHTIGEQQSVMWGRAVYSDHYLDSWGEILILDCPSESSPLRLVHGLWVDLDLLKGGGIFARLTRWKARNAFIDQGQKYLDSVAEYVQKK